MKEPTRVINHSVTTIEEKFIEAAELREDERAFKSEKPSSCSHCKKRFVEAAELNQHELANNSDEAWGLTATTSSWWPLVTRDTFSRLRVAI